MIDLHAHILHGLDDGARTLADSLAMAREAVADGIRVMAATPHSPASSASLVYDPAVIRARTAELRAALREEGVPLELVVGTEVTYEAGMVRLLQRGELLPYEDTRVVLLEPPYGGLPESMGVTLFQLQIAGFRVVLAHPERLPDVQDDPNRLLPLIERGVLMQLTGQALVGQQGDLLRTTAETLLMHRMVHVLASDAHGVAPRRPPALAAARERAAALVGPEAAAALVESTPRAILEGRPITPPPPRAVARKRRW